MQRGGRTYNLPIYHRIRNSSLRHRPSYSLRRRGYSLPRAHRHSLNVQKEQIRIFFEKAVQLEKDALMLREEAARLGDTEKAHKLNGEADRLTEKAKELFDRVHNPRGWWGGKGTRKRSSGGTKKCN